MYCENIDNYNERNIATNLDDLDTVLPQNYILHYHHIYL